MPRATAASTIAPVLGTSRSFFFFFKKKTAYEIRLSLVGSEMCIRDRKGYCVQFATAMVMMSRAAGIPAHMALGFLPGSSDKGVWTVIAADAHAWPELYLDGLGWTRFEPTPSRAAPPAYATPSAAGGASGDGSTSD